MRIVPRICRSAVLLVVVLLAAAATTYLTAPVVAGAVATVRQPDRESAVVMASVVTVVAAAGLALVTCWVALATTWCLVQSLCSVPGRPLRPHWLVPRLVRLLVGAAVGTSVLTGPAAAASARAQPAEECPLPQALAGLPLPDRPTGAPPATAPRDPAIGTGRQEPSPDRRVHAVVAGESLWSVAADQLPDGAPAAVVDGAWRAIYDANRRAVGEQPDLILPGTRLRLPQPLF